MPDLPSFLMPHRVAVETYLGETGTDDVYAAKVSDVPARQEGELLVTAEGQRSGSVKLFLRQDQTDRFLVESRVTFKDGETTGYVRAVADHGDGGAGAWQHLEVSVR